MAERHASLTLPGMSVYQRDSWQSEVELGKLIFKIEFDPVGRGGDASIAGRLEDRDSESPLGQLRDPGLHPLIDVDRLRRSVRPCFG
jgi:hypothetical protein